MKTQQTDLWKSLRRAYRPAVPDLDTAAIMAAVRREAAQRPLRTAAAHPVAVIPTWVCAAAACLALFATGSILVRAARIADQQINSAWMLSVEPEQFAETFLTSGNPTL
ncbi:MAG: hypothetical protein RBT03_01850 [Kiritimatiellia bacterium]|jgi:hypothetical protein|nr:hypothetical protein [Kiritimatiellia bacterium]